MGSHRDLGFRLKEVRRYISDKVKRARRIIYNLGQAVAGPGINGILRSTSLVPTVVSALHHSQLVTSDQI